MMMSVRVGVFVVLSDILELLIAQVAIERTQHCRDLVLDCSALGNHVLAHSPLFLGLFNLSFRIELPPLRNGGLDHTNILIGFSQPRQVILDIEWDGVHTSVSR